MKNFFDTVKQDTVKDIPEECFLKGIPRQGLPTSPMVASLALLETAYKIHDELKVLNKFALSIYADDITISFNNRMEFSTIRNIVLKEVFEGGFKINTKKTKILFGHKPGMKRIICGVAVGSEDIQASRYYKRLEQTAIHFKDYPKAMGLNEWNSLKEPKVKKVL